jgi:hypothetical protein
MAASEIVYRTEVLKDSHNRSAFVSGVESLDKYLKLQSGQDAKRKISVTFVLVSKTDSESIVGYYTLSSTTIEPSGLPAEVRKKLPPYPLIPATLIGRLARDIKHKGSGIGKLLLVDALTRSLLHSQEIASYAVVVDALDSKAHSWYSQQWGFIPIQGLADKLYLPMKTIEELLKNRVPV